MLAAGAASLRNALRRGELIAAPGVSDPYSALILESLGFPAGYLGGNALGIELGVGQPFVTLTETAEAVHRIGRVVKVPIIVDAGAGFGDAVHAGLAVRALIHAGAAAFHIDDQLYPKRAHYHAGKGHLANTESVCAKLREAVAARGSDECLVIARTDALRVTRSVEETLVRCSRYAETGVDALMILDLGIDQIRIFRAAMPNMPIAWIGGIAEPVPTAVQLHDAGFAIAAYPFNTIGAATEAMLATWRDFTTTGRPALPLVPTAKTVAKALSLIGLEHYLEIERATTECPLGDQPTSTR